MTDISPATFPNSHYTATDVWNVERYGVGITMPLLWADAALAMHSLPTVDSSIAARIKAIRVTAWVDLVGPAYASVVTQRMSEWAVASPWMTEFVEQTPVTHTTGGVGTLRVEWSFAITLPANFVAPVLNVRWGLPAGFAPTSHRAVVTAYRTTGIPIPRFA